MGKNTTSRISTVSTILSIFIVYFIGLKEEQNIKEIYSSYMHLYLNVFGHIGMFVFIILVLE